MVNSVINYLGTPQRVVIILMNLVLWLFTYKYVRKTLKEYGKWWKNTHKEIGKTKKNARKVVVIGYPKSGKSTTIYGLQYCLRSRNYVIDNPIGVSLQKTPGIIHYNFNKIERGNSTGAMVIDSITISDFAGEISTTLGRWNEWDTDDDESEVDFGRVIFDVTQVREIKEAATIIYVIYWKDDINFIKKQIDMYFPSILKAMGIIENKKYISVNKNLVILVTHIDEAEKPVNYKDVKDIIYRILPFPPTLFKKFWIIPTNPRRFKEEFETGYNIDIEKMEKLYGYDILVTAVTGKTQGGGEYE